MVPELVGRETTASERVIEMVADREGVAPTDLEHPLFESIDPDALDALVGPANAETGRSHVRVGFSYYNYDVEVTADGTVRVFERT